MNSNPKIFSTARIARLKLRFGSAVIFASLAAAGQAESLYPQPLPLPQTEDIVRPCTKLEKSAKLSPTECGTLSLANVFQRLDSLNSDNEDD